MKGPGWTAVVFIPRVFSSCTMRMLTAGGLVPVADGRLAHLPDTANPGGYFESRAVNLDPVATLSGMDLDRRCVKTMARHVPPLLAAGIIPARALVMRRPFTESEASFARAFRGSVQRTWHEMTTNLDIAHAALLAAGVPTMEVHADHLIDDPPGTAAAIATHCGLPADRVPAMAAVVDPALRHFDQRTR